MAIFGPKPWVNPFGKISIFRLFLTSCYYSLEKRFIVAEYCQINLPRLYCLSKKYGKMAILGPKPWVNPFGKISIFDFLNFWFLQLGKALYPSRISYNTSSWPIVSIYKKIYMEKWPFLDQNHRLTPLEKSQFFDFLNFLLLQRRKPFYRFRIS